MDRLKLLARELRKNQTEKELKLWNVLTEYLESRGYKVIRFWNNEIDQNIGGVYQKLQEIVIE